MISQLYTCCIVVQDLTEREEQTMRHEDKSQCASMTRPKGFVDCFFARL